MQNGRSCIPDNELQYPTASTRLFQHRRKNPQRRWIGKHRPHDRACALPRTQQTAGTSPWPNVEQIIAPPGASNVTVHAAAATQQVLPAARRPKHLATCQASNAQAPASAISFGADTRVHPLRTLALWPNTRSLACSD